MRLLRIDGDGDFSLVERVGNNIPPYAILSHTWGADEEEVTFKDLIDGVGKTKAGYRKIRFCGKQAANDKLEYFWIDTCSIDKSSSAELSEAINSMFRWYQNATKCYVYLSDVSISSLLKKDRSFQKSRWFTRGWTLQELVAPTSVEFFSAEGEKLGDKGSLVQELAEITGISVQALQGRPLSQFSVSERMAWAKTRETKREEDAAYSLLGIFDIHMPLIYGEGREKTLKRLRHEIHLPIMAPDAPKSPIKFKDCIGRKFSFPWHLCKTWKGMEELIRQAFIHIDVIGPHVFDGHYDLVDSDGEIILPQVWETMIKPDMAITMHMWPAPEPPPPPPPPPILPPPPIEWLITSPPTNTKKKDKSKKRDSVRIPPPPHGMLPPPPPPPPPPPSPPQIIPVELLTQPAPKKKEKVTPSPFMLWAAGGKPRGGSSRPRKT